MWQTLIGAAVAAALGALLVRQYVQEARKKRALPARFFGEAVSAIDGACLEDTGAAGLPRLVGTYNGFSVQLHPVIDTLATRRLPALWLLATLQAPLPVTSKFNMMMRPSGPTSFSNFDLLPLTIKTPAGFPDHAVIRTDDDTGQLLPATVVAPHLAPFRGARAKELLIAPAGLRIVWLLAEADRARYGVFRQAEFGDVTLDPDLVRDLLDRLIALRETILQWHRANT